MPLLLNKESRNLWLNKDANENDLLNLLNLDSKVELESYTVSPRISVLSANESTLFLPTAPADQFGNLTLFD